MSENAHACDELFACATRKLAGRDVAGERYLKNPPADPFYLDGGFQQALGDCGAAFVDSGQTNPSLPHWWGTLSGFDVVVRKDEVSGPLCVGELKAEKTDEVLWDLYKVIDAVSAGAEAGYLVVAATNKQWNKRQDCCTEIFTADPAQSSRQLFEANKNAWLWLLKGGSARPLVVPAKVTITPIETSSVKVLGVEGSLRCVRVAPRGTESLPFPLEHFGGDWPLGVEPARKWFDWPGRGRRSS